ncbi:MAG: hypothetical protein QW650_05910 [Thermofilum sp.]
MIEQDIRWAVARVEGEGISLARCNYKVILAAAGRLEIPLPAFDKQLPAQASRSGIEVVTPTSARASRTAGRTSSQLAKSLVT